MTEPRFAISKVVQFEGVTMNVTIREGYTSNMVLDTERHFVVAARALRDRTEVHPDFHTRDDYGLPPDHGCSRVNIYGDVNGISINKCNEFTTALDLVTNARTLMIVTAVNGKPDANQNVSERSSRDVAPPALPNHAEDDWGRFNDDVDTLASGTPNPFSQPEQRDATAADGAREQHRLALGRGHLHRQRRSPALFD